MALGVGVWVAWTVWTRTRTIEPLDVPVRVAAGQNIEQAFRLNYDGLYLIEIVPDQSKQTEPQLGVIGAEWALLNRGMEIKKGNTTEAHSAPGDGRAGRVIGDFNGRAGESYELQLRFTTDAPNLWIGEPHLSITVSGLARENLQAAGVLMSSMMFICELFGAILVGISVWGSRRSRNRESSR